MKISELRRTKLEVRDIEFGGLAKRASSVLGYTTLLSDTKDCVYHTTALNTLAKLGIDPLNTASVERYQEEMVRKNTHWYKFDVWRWYFQRIDAYREKIPLFALSRALEIKEHFSCAAFYVAEMRRESEAYPDPFLVLSRHSMFTHHLERQFLPWVIYLDVWDEPAFEGRRTV